MLSSVRRSQRSLINSVCVMEEKIRRMEICMHARSDPAPLNKKGGGAIAPHENQA
jgi:hypothetical protein